MPVGSRRRRAAGGLRCRPERSGHDRSAFRRRGRTRAGRGGRRSGRGGTSGLADRGDRRMRLLPAAHVERRNAPRWTIVSLTIVVMIVGGTAGRVEFLRRGADETVGAGVGTVIALLIVWGIPSLGLSAVA